MLRVGMIRLGSTSRFSHFACSLFPSGSSVVARSRRTHGRFSLGVVRLDGSTPEFVMSLTAHKGDH